MHCLQLQMPCSTDDIPVTIKTEPDDNSCPPAVTCQEFPRYQRRIEGYQREINSLKDELEASTHLFQHFIIYSTAL